MIDDAALSPFGVTTQGPTVNDLPEEARQWLERQGQSRRYRRDEAIQHRSVVPAHASWLRAGRIRSVVVKADGAEQHQGWVLPSELFGVNNMLLQCPSRVTLLADTDVVDIQHFTREVLQAMLQAMPEARVGIAVGLSRRIQQLHDVLDVNGPRSLVDKMRVVLVWWVKNHGIPARDGSVELWASQNDLANGVGASRQRVHLELQNLRDLGEVDLAYRKIIIRPLFFQQLERSAAAKPTP